MEVFTSSDTGGNLADGRKPCTFPIPPFSPPEAIDQSVKHMILMLMPDILSSDIGALQNALISFTTILTVEKPPIQEALELGVVPRLIELSSHDDQLILNKSVWSLCNMAGGNPSQCEYLVSCGVLEVFKRRFEDGSDQSTLNALWGVGNITGDAPRIRNLCLELGMMPFILELLYSSCPNTRGVAAWVVSNLCHTASPSSYDELKSCIPIILERLKTETDEIILRDCSWSLLYLSDCDSSFLFDSNIASDLLSILVATDQVIILDPILSVIGNFCSVGTDQVDYLLKLNLLLVLYHVSQHVKLTETILWTLEGIFSGSAQQNASAMPFIPFILNVLLTSYDPKTLKEAIICLGDAISNCSPEGFEAFLSFYPQHHFLNFLHSPGFKCLTASDVELVRRITDKLYNEIERAQLEPLFETQAQTGNNTDQLEDSKKGQSFPHGFEID